VDGTTVAATLRRQDFLERLRSKDPGLWPDGPKDPAAIASRLGWLSVHRDMLADLPEIEALGAWVRELGFRDVVLLGMGGSSLAPEVFQETFGAAPGYPSLTVLDTTDPTAIASAEARLDLEVTLFIVSSKSGTTIETASLQRYFAERTRDLTGDTGALDNFIAITDPDTQLHHQAIEEGYHRVFLNPPDIGGRFSGLSFFGLVPAVAIGVDVGRVLHEADTLDEEEALDLGAWLADNAKAGKDKLTFLNGQHLRGFGAWAEQLVAESTGKDGKGIVPVAGEDPAPLGEYGDDRAFIAAAGPGDAAHWSALEAARHPLFRVEVGDPYEIGREFLRWEIATVAAGTALEIYPFDEPNVEESKGNTRRVLGEYMRSGALPEAAPTLVEPGAALHVAPEAEGVGTIAEQVAHWFGRGRPGRYGSIMAYVAPNDEHDLLLNRLRNAVREATQLAVTIGYGPRFLHSAGQLHKGGPNTGIFLQITTDDATDEDIPGEAGYGFGTLKAAQALGDFQALAERNLDIIRVHLRGETTESLQTFVESVESAMQSNKEA
jgi:glucose-6-phosphate isomerase